MQPKIPPTNAPFIVRECKNCKGTYGPESFLRTNSLFYPDGYLPICEDCVEKIASSTDYNWNTLDKLCQYMDIPFVPAEFVKMQELEDKKPFVAYAKAFLSGKYGGVDWGEYNEAYKRLKEQKKLDEEVPLVKEEKLNELRKKWGSNYDEEELRYLEDLYNGVMLTQNVSSALQGDQTLKLCKISLEIDSRIREGGEIDKLLSSYDKLVKIADFTPKNIKNANDFDSIGELIRWLEKRGWRATFYDNVTRDIVDETIKNIQVYNQRLYTNETGIGDEITQRIEALKHIDNIENNYDLKEEYDADEFENEAYTKLMAQDFVADLEDENESI